MLRSSVPSRDSGSEEAVCGAVESEDEPMLLKRSSPDKTWGILLNL